LFADAAVDFLTRYEDEAPFFLYLPFTAPHDPRMAPRKYDSLYRRQDIELPPNFLPRHPFDNGEMVVRDETLAPWPRTPEVVREHIAAYYAMITHLDDQIGRVLRALEDSGHGENTIIIFAGDNGLAVGQHGLMGKQSMYDHSVRVPLVMAGPGLPSGVRRDHLCYLMDIFPTICEMTGLATPDSVEGQSLLPVAADEPDAGRGDLYFAYTGIQRAVRDSRYKLIEYYVDGVRTTQLFDLVANPAETENLAADPGQHEVVERLRQRLRDWQAAADDPVAGQWPA
jgi:arylsulfatase A-like enzyme